MPRPQRIEYEGAFHHVMNRGRGRMTIFHDEAYYEVFLETLQEASQRFDAVIHAYCLMKNHYHLLIETPRANLSRIMRHVNGVYTQRYNRIKDGWVNQDYVYQTVKKPAQMLSPVDATTLTNTPVTFSWEAPPFGANKVQLRIGTKPGWSNLLLSDFTLDQTSASVPLSLNGAPVYVRLRTLFPEGWVNQDYVYPTTNGVAP